MILSKIDLKNRYNLVVFHPVTTEYGISYEQTQKLINVINNLNVQTIWLWPNVDAGSDGISKCLRKNRENKNLRNVQLIKNFPVEFYNYLNNLKSYGYKQNCIFLNWNIASSSRDFYAGTLFNADII